MKFDVIPKGLEKPYKFIVRGRVRHAVALSAAERAELEWLAETASWLAGTWSALDTDAVASFEAAVAINQAPVPSCGATESRKKWSGGQGWDGLHGDTAEDGAGEYIETAWAFPTPEDAVAYKSAEAAWMESLAASPAVQDVHARMQEFGKVRAEFFRRRRAAEESIGEEAVQESAPIPGGGMPMSRSISEWLCGWYGHGIRHRLRVH